MLRPMATAAAASLLSRNLLQSSDIFMRAEQQNGALKMLKYSTKDDFECHSVLYHLYMMLSNTLNKAVKINMGR